MRIIAFSDIHGNQFAFRAFLRELEKYPYDRLIFCGDVFGYYYGQREIIRELKKLNGLIAVKGNHDQIAVNVLGGKARAEQYFAKYGHSYGMLNREDVDYVGSLPDHIVLREGGKTIGVMHGSPADFLEDRIYPRDEITNPDVFQPYDIVICGHTHFQMVRRAGDCWIVNAGSVGQQRDGKGFCFVQIDTEAETAQYHTFRFSIEQLEEEIRKYDPDCEKLSAILHRGE